MEITDIHIRLMNEEHLKAFASVTFDNCFVVHNMKVVEGENRIFLCMPSRKTAAGDYRDLVHPITRSFRACLEEKVLKVYRDACAAQANEPQAAQAEKVQTQDMLKNTQSVF